MWWRSNPRLLDYVQNGGTLLVLYERDFAWNEIVPAPIKAEMAAQAARVTDPEFARAISGAGESRC